MMPDKEPSREKQPAKGALKGKKPYKKPEFRHERVFETMALACGKVNSTQPSCQFSRKSS